MSETIDTAGIAELLACTRAHATTRVVKQPGFPAPVLNLSQRLRRWNRAEVEAYLKAGPRSAPPSRGSSAPGASAGQGAR